MAKKKTKKNSNNKKKNITTNKVGDSKKIILICILILIVVGVLASTIYNSSKIKNKETNMGVETMELRDFIEVDLDEVMEMINAKKGFVLYVGYTGCQACEKYSPILKRVQSQNEVDTYYLDYKSIDKKSKEWKTLTNKIDVEQKLTISKDGEKVTIDDKIGNIMKEHGYTPVTIVFENGKCVNAHIGSMSSSQVTNFLGY